MNQFNSIFQIILLIILAKTAQAAPPEKKEFRLGIMRHDIGSSLKQRHERGQNIIGEYIFDNQYEFLYAVPHVGITINNGGYTSAIYAGVTWRFDITNILFLDATFGGAVNNAQRKQSKKRKAVGSNLLFRESLSLGIYMGEYTISVMVDHMSNARLAPPNPGLTDFGIRIGYSF